MSSDRYFSFLDRGRDISIGVAVTTTAVGEAIRRHELQSTSGIILGRLLTAAVLVGLGQKRGPLSLQVVGDGQAGQVFADVTEAGAVRGYVRGRSLSFPVTSRSFRRSVAAAIGKGSLSVIRPGPDSQFAQSTTELIDGEIDSDVESYLRRSEQTSSSLCCEVICADDGGFRVAAGILFQALPAGDKSYVEGLGAELRRRFAGMVGVCSAAEMVHAWLPDAVEVEQPAPVAWQCRCNAERVLAALAMMGPTELAAMVDEKEAAEVTCDFCRDHYSVPAAEIEEIFLKTIVGRG